MTIPDILILIVDTENYSRHMSLKYWITPDGVHHSHAEYTTAYFMFELSLNMIWGGLL